MGKVKNPKVGKTKTEKEFEQKIDEAISVLNSLKNQNARGVSFIVICDDGEGVNQVVKGNGHTLIGLLKTRLLALEAYIVSQIN